jgi:hypothetical protein
VTTVPTRAGPMWNAVAAVSQQPRTRILFASGVFRNKWRMSLHALAADASCNALKRPRSARSPRKCTWCFSSPQQTLRFCARVWKNSAPKFLHACFTALLRQSYAIATRGRLVHRQIHNARQLEVPRSFVSNPALRTGHSRVSTAQCMSLQSSSLNEGWFSASERNAPGPSAVLPRKLPNERKMSRMTLTVNCSDIINRVATASGPV